MSILIKDIHLPDAYGSATLTVYECGEGRAVPREYKITADQMQEMPPHAQIEPLTYNEQSIFLAAMRREEKVCKRVNEEYEGREGPFEVDLVRICHEITRKVKGALWTI